MRHYLFRLNPPRASFPANMTPAEADAMQRHLAYWSGLMAEGHVLAFGPVADPRGAYGIGILQLADEVDPHALAAADPVVQAGLGFTCEVHPMPRLVLPTPA